MVHDRFNIEKWISRFPLTQARREARDFVEQRRLEMPGEYPDEKAVEEHVALMAPGGDIVSSPRDIAITEQLRREGFAGQHVEGVPTDIFVFARGEPSRREATKLGGLPYWPAWQEWPCAANGTPLAFVGQFCFEDSRDTVGKLPGDVLVIFGTNDGEYLSLDESELEFFWRDMGDGDLIEPSAMPGVELPIPPSYGVIHRTFDYPGAEALLQRCRYPELLAILEGTKIGGVPRWIQDPEPVRGRFLCALGSLSFPVDLPYPFVNMPEPIGDMAVAGPKWGDMGSLYVFLEGDDILDAVVQCY